MNTCTIIDNAKFMKMNKNRRKVVLAKDVLAQLKAKKYIADRGRWVKIFEDKGDGTTKIIDARNFNEQFNSFGIQEKIVSCQVCGLGSLLCSLVKINNHATVGDIVSVDSLKLFKRLGIVFSDEEMMAIEIAFERGNGQFYVDEMFYKLTKEIGHIYIYKNDNKRKFYKKHKYNKELHDYLLAAKEFSTSDNNPEDRLTKIMNNIIENKGLFKPNGIYYK